MCDWLYDWWSGEESKESVFVLSCVPDLLWVYLFKTAHGIALPGGCPPLPASRAPC